MQNSVWRRIVWSRAVGPLSPPRVCSPYLLGFAGMLGCVTCFSWILVVDPEIGEGDAMVEPRVFLTRDEGTGWM